VDFVRSSWNGLLATNPLNPMDSLVKKIKLLKMLLIFWERKKKVVAKEELLCRFKLTWILYTLSSQGDLCRRMIRNWSWKKKK
jgi:hypothetical protein